jgi:hypothetical protein
MKRCPKCSREYNDETLNFCLDDGIELLYGPAGDEPATAILSEPGAIPTGSTASEAKTRTFEPEADDAPVPTPTSHFTGRIVFNSQSMSAN